MAEPRVYTFDELIDFMPVAQPQGPLEHHYEKTRQDEIDNIAQVRRQTQNAEAKVARRGMEDDWAVTSVAKNFAAGSVGAASSAVGTLMRVPGVGATGEYLTGASADDFSRAGADSAAATQMATDAASGREKVAMAFNSAGNSLTLMGLYAAASYYSRGLIPSKGMPYWFGANTASNEYTKAVDSGMDENYAIAYGMGQGAVETAITIATMKLGGVLGDKLGKTKAGAFFGAAGGVDKVGIDMINKVQGKLGATEATRHATARFLGSFFGEQFEEGLQTQASMAYEDVFNPHTATHTLDQRLDAAADTFIATALTVAGMEGGRSVVNQIQKQEDIRSAFRDDPTRKNYKKFQEQFGAVAAGVKAMGRPDGKRPDLNTRSHRETAAYELRREDIKAKALGWMVENYTDKPIDPQNVKNANEALLSGIQNGFISDEQFVQAIIEDGSGMKAMPGDAQLFAEEAEKLIPKMVKIREDIADNVDAMTKDTAQPSGKENSPTPPAPAGQPRTTTNKAVLEVHKKYADQMEPNELRDHARNRIKEDKETRTYLEDLNQFKAKHAVTNKQWEKTEGTPPEGFDIYAEEFITSHPGYVKGEYAVAGEGGVDALWALMNGNEPLTDNRMKNEDFLDEMAQEIIANKAAEEELSKEKQAEADRETARKRPDSKEPVKRGRKPTEPDYQEEIDPDVEDDYDRNEKYDSYEDEHIDAASAYYGIPRGDIAERIEAEWGQDIDLVRDTWVEDGDFGTWEDHVMEIAATMSEESMDRDSDTPAFMEDSTESLEAPGDIMAKTPPVDRAGGERFYGIPDNADNPNLKKVKSPSVRKILEWASRTWNVPFYKGRMDKGSTALGVYWTRTGQIRTRRELWGNLGVQTHELMHRIDLMIKLSENFPQHLEAELMSMDYQVGRPSIVVGKMEGLAEWWRAWTFDRNIAVAEGPNVTKYMEEEWGKKPENKDQWEKMQKYREMVQQHIAKTAYERVQERFDQGPEVEVPGTKWERAKIHADNIWNYVNIALQDRLRGFDVVDKYAEEQYQAEQADLRAKGDPSADKAGTKSSRVGVKAWFENTFGRGDGYANAAMEGDGVYNPSTSKIIQGSKSIKMILDEYIPEEYRRDFEVYMVAKMAAQVYEDHDALAAKYAMQGKKPPKPINPGFARKDVVKLRNEMEADPMNGKNYLQAMKEITKHKNQVLKALVGVGYMSPEEYLRVIRAREFYAPMLRETKGKMFDRDALGKGPVGGNGRQLYELRGGSDLRIKGPMVSMRETTAKIYKMAHSHMAYDRMRKAWNPQYGGQANMGKHFVKVNPTVTENRVYLKNLTAELVRTGVVEQSDVHVWTGFDNSRMGEPVTNPQWNAIQAKYGLPKIEKKGNPDFQQQRDDAVEYILTALEQTDQAPPSLESMLSLFENSYKPVRKKGEKIIAIPGGKGGKVEMYQISDDLSVALDNTVLTDSRGVEVTLNAIGHLTRVKKLGIVLNPAFAMGTAPIKDAATFLFSSQHAKGLEGLYGAVWGVLNTASHALKNTQSNNFNKFAQTISDAIGLKPTDEYTKLFYLESGEIGNTHLRSGATADLQTQNHLRMDKTPGRKTKGFIQDTIKGYVDFAASFENGARRSEFAYALRSRGVKFDYDLQKWTKGGKEIPFVEKEDVVYALAAAAELSPFGRTGTIGSRINKVSAFWNPAVVGIFKGFRMLKDPFTAKNMNNEFDSSATDMKVRNAGALGLLVTFMASYLAYKHDDDEYDEMPPHVWGNYFVFGSGEDKFLVPKPFGFVKMAMSILEGAYRSGSTSDKDALMKGVKKELSEIKEPFTGDSAMPGWGMMPDAVQLLMAIRSGEGDFGRPINPRSQLKLPHYERSSRDTTLLMKKVAFLIKDIPGIGKWTPAELEYAVKQYTGGAFQKSYGAAERYVRGVGNRSDIPLVSSFVRPFNQSRTITDFYELKNSIDEQHASAEALHGGADRELKISKSRISAYNRLMSELRPANDVRSADTINQWKSLQTGLTRFILGQPALEDFPNPLTASADRMTEDQVKIRDHWLELQADHWTENTKRGRRLTEDQEVQKEVYTRLFDELGFEPSRIRQLARDYDKSQRKKRKEALKKSRKAAGS